MAGAFVYRPEFFEALRVFSASYGNTSSRVHDLLDSGATLESRDEQGDTPLLIACKNREWLMVCELLDRGADFNALNDYGQRPKNLIMDAVALYCDYNGNNVLTPEMQDALEVEPHLRKAIALLQFHGAFLPGHSHSAAAHSGSFVVAPGYGGGSAGSASHNGPGEGPEEDVPSLTS